MTHEDGLRPEESLYPIIDLRAAQRRTSLTAIYPFAGLGTAQALMYIGLGLAGEAGEVANQVKKIARDDGGMLTPERRDKIFKEVRDVLWYWLRFCEEMGFDPYHIMASMFEKLEVRHANGTIQGDGEERAVRLGVDPGSPLGFILSEGLVGEVRTHDGKELQEDGRLREKFPPLMGLVGEKMGIGSAVHKAIEEEQRQEQERVVGGLKDMLSSEEGEPDGQ